MATRTARQVAQAIIEASDSQEKMVSELQDLFDAWKAQDGPAAKAQYHIVNLIEKIAVANRMPVSMPTIADDIMMTQKDKIARYGKAAYGMSEKQLATVVRVIWGYIK